MRKALVILGVLATCGVIYGLLGPVHRSADAIAMLSPIFGCVMVVGAYATRVAWVRVWMGLSGVLVMGATLIFFQPQEPGDALRLYSKNLKFSNGQMDEIGADITAANVDLVMLQEVSDANQDILTQLKGAFPHQHVCDFGSRYDIAVLSRVPFDDGGLCSKERAIAAVPVRIDDQRVWAVSVHLPWPWPDNTAANDRAAKALLTLIDGPFVVAGDFNIFPWSGRLRRIRAITETRMAGPTHVTFSHGLLRAAIDHVLGPAGGAVERRPLFGSDHYGLVAHIGL